MNTRLFYFLLAVVLLQFFSPNAILAQQTGSKGDITLEEKPSIISVTDTSQTNPPKVVELLHAGELEGDILPTGEKIRIVRRDESDQVLFKQGNTLMYADTVYQYLASNKIKAFGNIRFVEKDSITLQGDTLYYDGNSKLARLRGNVVMEDQDKTMQTRKLNYNLKTRIAYYFEGGVIQDQSSRLNSDRGYYNTDTRVATFRGNVNAMSPQQRVKTDSMTYNTVTGNVFFDSDAEVITPDGNIDAGKGTVYNTITRKMKTRKGSKSRTKINNRDYIISARDLDYDNLTEKGKAKKDVQIYAKKDNITIFGDETYYDGLTNRMDIFGSAIMVKPLQKDTLYISADTLIALSDTVAGEQRFYAYRNVKIYKSDMQGICDSLNYDLKDSVLYFNYDPVLWSKNNQLSGSAIKAVMQDNTIDSLLINEKAFVVSSDSFGQYNQIKGRDLLARFDSGFIKKVDVNGNGESIYYMIETQKNGEALLKGMNYIKCSNIFMNFESENKLSDILFTQQPEGKVIPPQKITMQNSRLNNFNWRIDEKPDQSMVLQGKNVADAIKNTYKPDKKQGKLLLNKYFKVYLDKKNNQLIYYRHSTRQSDLTHPFFLRVYPKYKKDLETEDDKERGYLLVPFYLEDYIQEPNAEFRHTRPLPDIKILKIITGQQIEGRNKWIGTYMFPSK